MNTHQRKAARLALPVVLVTAALVASGCSTSTEGSASGGGSEAASAAPEAEASAAASSAAPVTGKVSFMVAEYSPKTAPFWEKTIEACEAENPGVEIDLEVVGWQQMYDTTAQRIAADALPDLVNTATIWLPEWVEAGALQPVTDSLLSPELKADFVPALLEKGGEYNGEAWGLPIAAAARGMFYNKDLLAKAGLDGPPATWADLQQYATAIKDATGEFGYAFDAKGVQAFRYFGFFLWNNGGDFFDADGKAAFNSPEGVEALQYLTDMAESGAIPDPTGTALEDFQPLFQTGRLGMMIDGNFFDAAIADKAPDLQYGVAPVPISGSDVQPVTWGVTDTLVVNKNTDPALASVVLSCLYKPEVRTEFDTNEGLLPVLQSQVSDPAFADENTQAWIAMLGNARFDPLNANYAQMQELVKTAMQESLKGVKSPQQALDDAAAKFNELAAGN